MYCSFLYIINNNFQAYQTVEGDDFLDGLRQQNLTVTPSILDHPTITTPASILPVTTPSNKKTLVSTPPTFVPLDPMPSSEICVTMYFDENEYETNLTEVLTSNLTHINVTVNNITNAVDFRYVYASLYSFRSIGLIKE